LLDTPSSEFYFWSKKVEVLSSKVGVSGSKVGVSGLEVGVLSSVACFCKAVGERWASEGNRFYSKPKVLWVEADIPGFKGEEWRSKWEYLRISR
jgi:hypothetical protein